MFREPEDSDVLVAGWPWHGLVVDGQLTLPSGRTLQISRPLASTSLWDIGRPDPEPVGDDPDVQWWGKAIIRGGRYFYSGGDPIFPGTQEKYSEPPVYVGGQVLPARNLSVSVNAVGGGVHRVRAKITVDDVLYQSNTLLSSDFGIPPKSSLSGAFMDYRWDRGRWLIALTAIDGIYGILEARLNADASGLELELTPLALYSELWEPEIFIDEPVNIPESGRLDEGPYKGAPLAGTYVAKRRGRLLARAFYRLDATVERVYLHVDAESRFETSDLTQYPHARVWANRGSLWVQGETLGTTSAVTFETSLEHYRVEADGGLSDSTRQVDSINGAIVHEKLNDPSYVNYTFRYGDVPAWFVGGDITMVLDTMLGSFDDSYRWGSALYAGARAASNNISQAGVTALFYIDGWRRVDVISVSSALTPSGIHAGSADFDSRDWPSGQPGDFSSGSYNPVTGQVMRNDPEHRYSWV